MHIPQMRQALADVADLVPDIRTALPYPPRQVGPLPMFWVGELRARVDMGNLETWTWRATGNLALKDVGDYGASLREAERILGDLMEAIRSNYQMFEQLPPGVEIMGLNLEELSEGMLKIGNVDHPGWTMVVELQEIVTVRLEG